MPSGTEKTVKKVGAIRRCCIMAISSLEVLTGKEIWKI
jgi:hypothetical protein